MNKISSAMHVSYYVSDIEKTVDFYRTFFGQEPEKVKTDYAKFELKEPALVISFIQNPAKAKADFGHLGIRVSSPELVERKKLEMMSNHIPIFDEKQVDCCYALQDKFWVSDPDGYKWEVYYFYHDTEGEERAKAAGESSAACCTPMEQGELNVVSSVSESCCSTSQKEDAGEAVACC